MILHKSDIEPLRLLATWKGLLDMSSSRSPRNPYHVLQLRQLYSNDIVDGYTNSKNDNLLLNGITKANKLDKFIQLYRNITAREVYTNNIAKATQHKIKLINDFIRDHAPCEPFEDNLGAIKLVPEPQDWRQLPPIEPPPQPTWQEPYRPRPWGMGPQPAAPQPAAPQPPVHQVAPAAPAARHTPANATKYPHYFREVNQTHVDVYWVLDAFGTGSSSIDHAVKKLLAAGKRGSKDRLKDLKEAMDSIARAIELEESK